MNIYEIVFEVDVKCYFGISIIICNSVIILMYM